MGNLAYISLTCKRKRKRNVSQCNPEFTAFELHPSDVIIFVVQLPGLLKYMLHVVCAHVGRFR